MGELSEKIEGIGPTYEARLIGAGIASLSNLRLMDKPFRNWVTSR